MTRFSPEEQAVLDNATPRQIMIARKLAALVGPEADCLEQSLPVGALVGEGYDDFDMRRVGLLLKNLKAMFDDFQMEGGFYRMRFNPASLSWIKKQAANRPASNGLGTLYGNAALALKRKMGCHGDVEFLHSHGHENFNCGEDTSYLDPAFFGFWRMNFVSCPHKFIKQNIEIRPIRHNWLEIGQFVICKAHGHKSCQGKSLAKVAVPDFLDPEKWEKTSSEIAGKAEAHLLSQIEALQEEEK